MLQEANDRPLKRENPHKYLLYKPTLSQLLVFLASGFKELPLNGALLLYISADGLFPSSSSTEDRKKLDFRVYHLQLLVHVSFRLKKFKDTTWVVFVPTANESRIKVVSSVVLK